MTQLTERRQELEASEAENQNEAGRVARDVRDTPGCGDRWRITSVLGDAGRHPGQGGRFGCAGGGDDRFAGCLDPGPDRLHNAEVSLERIARERVEQSSRIDRLEEQIVDELSRAEGVSEEAVTLREQAALQKAEAEAQARDHAERQQALDARTGQVAETEAELKVLREQAAELSEALAQTRLRQQEANLRCDNLEEQIRTGTGTWRFTRSFLITTSGRPLGQRKKSA